MPRIPTPTSALLVLIALPFAGGCVKRSTHRAVLADLASANALELELRDELARTEESLSAEIARLEQEVARLERERADLQSRLELAGDEVHRLEVLLSEQGTEYERLQARLESLAAIEQEVRERNRIYEDLIGRFRSLIDGGQVAVSIVRGRMVIQLPQDILFPSGSATLNAEGTRTLREVGAVLATLTDRSFQVEGHTDNVPISTERFPSNWELSSARALSVVRVLIDAGVRPANISGAGFGEHHPVASNDDADGRRLNRRIEIVMLPNLDVIAGAGGL